MDEKSKEIYRGFIKERKQLLAKEKKRLGYYEESNETRYEIPFYYIKMEDYKGGLRYLKWFEKNFLDDINYPQFLLGWSIIFFKSGMMEAATEFACYTYSTNIFVFDKYFGRDFPPNDLQEHMFHCGNPWFARELKYSESMFPKLKDFSKWLKDLEQTKEFKKIKIEFMKQRKKELKITSEPIILNKSTSVKNRNYKNLS